MSLPRLVSAQSDVGELQLGKSIERELKAGETHSFHMTLIAGQYVRGVVEQRGIDVVLTLFGFDEKKLFDIDTANGANGPEPFSFVAERSGNYRLEVRAAKQYASPGKYQANIEEIRAATQGDRDLIDGPKAYAQAQQLRARGTAESLRSAANKYEEALGQWRKLGVRQAEAETLGNLGRVAERLSEYSKALDYYNQALLIFRSLGNRQEEAVMIHNSGAVYFQLGEYEKALDYYN